jgi:hypothetical protein
MVSPGNSSSTNGEKNRHRTVSLPKGILFGTVVQWLCKQIPPLVHEADPTSASGKMPRKPSRNSRVAGRMLSLATSRAGSLQKPPVVR